MLSKINSGAIKNLEKLLLSLFLCVSIAPLMSVILKGKTQQFDVQAEFPTWAAAAVTGRTVLG